MGVIRNGVDYSNVIRNGNLVTGVIVNGENRLGEGSSVPTFSFSDAGISFSVSQSGIVSLSITSGTIASSTYSNGQNLGSVSTNTTRHNSITVNIPSGYSNSGTITMTVDAIQLAASYPSVVTNSASAASTFATLSGTITDDGGLPILESGFYFIQGTGYGSSTVANSGIYVYDGISTTGSFSENASGLSPDTSYSFIAFARNSAGTRYGVVRTFTTISVPAQAGYVLSGAGEFTGGTLAGTTNLGTGNWYGASFILPSSGSSAPTAASCASDQEFCTIYRDTQTRDRYINGTRTEEYTCVITQEGSGTPSCTNPNNPVGGLYSTTGTGSYFVYNTSTETRSVTNTEYESPGTEFDASHILVTSCGVSQNGNSVFVNTNYGTAIPKGTIAPNTTTQPRNVTVFYDVSGTIPDGYDEEFQTFAFTNLSTTCEQPGIDIEDPPSFDAFSATVTTLDGTQFASDGDFVAIEGAGGTYFVGAPTGTGGIVTSGKFGSGAFTIGGGQERVHSFSITNSQGTVSYSFTVESTI